MSQRYNNLTGSEMYGTLNREANPKPQGHVSLGFVLYAFDPTSQIISSVVEHFQHSIPFNLVCWSN